MLIAARNGFAVGGAQKNYVQDGLIAWNDGLLSEKGQLWQNLIPDSPIDDLSAPLEAGVLDVVENGYRFTNASNAYGLAAPHRISGYDGLTIEVITNGLSYAGSNAAISVGFNLDTDLFSRSYWRAGTLLAGKSENYISIPSDQGTNGKTEFGAYWKSNGDAGVINNGVIGKTTTFSSSAISPNLSYKFYINRYALNKFPSWTVSGIVYCCRVYSRALTADEIAANYAVDKARFGLP